MHISRIRRRVRLLIIIVVIVALITFIVSRFFIQPLNRMITTNYNLVSFTDSYMEKHNQSIAVEIPQAFELFHILAALAEDSSQQTQMLNRSTAYWQEAADFFAPYSDHPAVAHVHRLVQSRTLEALGRTFGFQIENSQLKERGVHPVSDYFETYAIDRHLIEDFIAVSDFKSFFGLMENYYAYEMDIYTDLVPLAHMRTWLESHFSISHQSYRVVLSPLLLGTQYTYLFRETEGDWSEIVMCVPTVNHRYRELSQQGVISEEQVHAFASLLVFTEIDHNYVNPVTDKFLNRLRISRIFANRSAWHTGMGYNGAALIFNEYMTWGLYGLYCHDTYTEETRDAVIRTLNDTMHRRGFIRFAEFMEGILDIYDKRPVGKRIEDLYGSILSMAAKFE